MADDPSRGGLRIRRASVVLEFQSEGLLLPWLGPALRGIVAGRLKAQECRHPPAERVTKWERCSGCWFLPDCAYGRGFEPEIPPGAEVLRGREGAARPLVLAPAFPAAELAEAGDVLALEVITVGPSADDLAPLLDALNDAGRAPGLGPDRVRFGARLAANPSDQEIPPETLPPHPDAGAGRVARLAVRLMTPWFPPAKTPPGPLAFADIFRAAMRGVSELFGLYAPGGRPRADYAALRDAAADIPLLDHAFEAFSQVKWSSRSHERFEARGAIGGGVYADVPMALVPWLYWGGQLGVGGHRVAGAGRWRLTLD